MDDMLNKLSTFQVDIPLVSAAANKVGSLLQDLLKSMPIKDLADEFNLFYARARDSVTAQNGAFDISVSLGQMNSVKKYGAVLKQKLLAAKFPSLSKPKLSVPIGAKRDMLNKLKAMFPSETAQLTLNTFVPSAWVEKLHMAYHLDASFAYSPGMSLTDIFAIRPPADVCF